MQPSKSVQSSRDLSNSPTLLPSNSVSGILLPATPQISNQPREKLNWRIHLLYIRQDFRECLKLIEEQLKESNGSNEYALYVKALIRRHEGEIQESLQLFQAASYLNPSNTSNLKQVGRSLYLLGRHTEALDVFDEISAITEDWEVYHNKGLCYSFLKDFPKAIESFRKANSISKQDCNYLQLGKIYTMQEDYKGAIEVFLEAIEFSPENPELLTTLGLLYLRIQENYRAFDYFGTALSFDPKNQKTILAAGSIIQDHSEVDVALGKYRIAVADNPNSAQLWNNIGMCFFGKQKYIPAIAALKKALYLAPFEWIIAFNLGLVHLNTGQYASAFHFFSASINLKQDFASTYMYLAITLNRLNDFENACSAYEKALELESDYLFELNYAITLFNRGEFEKSQLHLAKFDILFSELDEETKNSDQDVQEQRQLLMAAFSQLSGK